MDTVRKAQKENKIKNKERDRDGEKERELRRELLSHFFFVFVIVPVLQTKENDNLWSSCANNTHL